MSFRRMLGMFIQILHLYIMKTILSLFSYKRVVIGNIIIPILLGFLFLTLLGKNISHRLNYFDTTFSLGLVNLEADNELIQFIKNRKDIILEEGLDEQIVREKVRKKELDLGLIIPQDFNKKIAEGKQVELQLYHRNNTSDINDLSSSISRFETKVIRTRLDSFNLSMNYVNPVVVKETNTQDFIKEINQNVGNYTPLLVFVIGLLSLVWPSMILYSSVRKKNRIGEASYISQFLAISLFGVMGALFFILGMWCSIWFSNGHPSFLVGIMKKIFSMGGMLNLTWILFLTQFFAIGILNTLNHKAKTPVGAFGISFFVMSCFLVILLATSVLLSNWENISYSIVLFPFSNAIGMSKHIFIEEGISWSLILLFIIGTLVWGGASFLISKKIIQ